ncbi:hypothetical protein CRG98_032998 [Punica granatum]|uniref:Reverse transcriptase domain-containing protein n=1 Tax=Punica granatum TaxID=22663 RepID=A0A2I0ITB7_PUNGR|nr:hypothetical protein CRG98_032998 [Punica granatum]
MEDLISCTITDSDNEKLIQIPDDKEILTALNSIPSLKAPGPDEIPSLFYKHYGETVKPLLFAATKSFFTSGFILKEWNNTFICLIPKRQGASNFKDFRPISLCNVCYKVISKIIANRLKPLLDRIISPNQTAFIEGRWINENGLLAQEILHTMRKTKARRGWIGLKIDFTKAFDKLEWSFIIKIMEKLGFHSTFVSWIYQCISTSTFSILLNGSPHGQEVNCSKSGLFFSKNTSADIKRNAKAILGIRKLKEDAKYLGNPLFVKRKRKESFQFLVDKIKSKLASWKAKTISWAGRATLINSVINNTPIYTMSLFRLPKSTLNTIDQVTRRFWWGSTKESGSYFAPKNWESICKPKSEGGLGFRKAEDSNKAMLSKTAWALTKSNNSLAGRAMKAKYGNFLNPSNRSSPSPIWKGIQWCKDTIQAGTLFSVGNDSSISAWLDPWIPSTHDHKPSPNTNVIPNSELKGNQQIFTKPSKESKAATPSTSEGDKPRVTKKEALPLHLCSSNLHKSPQAPTGASLARTRLGEPPPHAYQESFTTQAILQHSHGSRFRTRTRRSKQRPELHSLHSQLPQKEDSRRSGFVAMH